MSIQKDLQSIFLPSQAEDILKSYNALYYQDLIKEYEAFYFAGDISEEFFSSTKNNDTIKYICELEFPQKDYVATMLILNYLRKKADERTEQSFFHCIKKHDMKTLKQILKHNDPDGRYNKMVQEIYKQ